MIDWRDKPAGAACAKCPGRDAPCVLPEGTPDGKRPRLAIVGEAPGQTEIDRGRPFVGASGRLMMRELEANELRRSGVHWTNAILCEVAPNDQAKARKCCAARLEEELAAVEPDVTLCVGALALQSAIRRSGKPSVLKYRGTIIAPSNPLRRDGRGDAVLPTVHPAFALRSEAWLPVLSADIARACRIAADAEWEPPEADCRLILDATDGGGALCDLRMRTALLGPIVAFDVETTGLGAMNADLLCYALSDGETALVVPYETLGQRERRESSQIVSRVLADRTTLTHNGPAFDHVVARRHGIQIADWDDTLLAAHVLEGHMPKRLGHVVANEIASGIPPWKEEPHDDSPAALHYYNARDVIYTALAGRSIFVRLDASGMRSVYDSDKISAELCREMQWNGFAFDVRRAETIGAALKARSAEIEAEAADLLGRPIKLSSPAQLKMAFFEDLRAPVVYRSVKTEAPSVGVDALRTYAAGMSPRAGRLAQLVLEYRRVAKTESTYVRIRPLADGRIHPSWLSYGAVSGRWSCQAPNLMNLVKAQHDPSLQWGGVRSLYQAPPGHMLVAYDKKQLEMRIAAYWSGDERMIAACESTDMHASNAAICFGMAFTGATDKALRKSLRDAAKNAGFAVCYLADAITVYERMLADGAIAALEAGGLKVTLRHIEAMLNNMRTAYAGYYAAQDENRARIIRTGYVTAPLSGRRRWLGRAPKPTEAANFPIQSGAADVINAELPRVVEAVRHLGARLVAMIHDAAIFECPTVHVERASAFIREESERPVQFPALDGRTRNVVFPIDLKAAKRWSDL